MAAAMTPEGETGMPGDIAIVGMAVRVPGARDLATFWTRLRDGVEAVRTYTEDELLEAGESPEVMSQPNYVRAGAPLEGMDRFDGEFFGFGPRDAAIMDPQHRQFLEVAWEALENAAHAPGTFAGPVGVWAGCGTGTYYANHVSSNAELVREVGLFLLRHTGNDKDFLPTRVSYLLNLEGPSMAVQSACSSSLTAVHVASQSLLAHEVDFALAGGVTIELPHRRGYLHHEGEVLSEDGHCRPFDGGASGTVFGSGAGVVVLRRLADALRDGDHVWAVLKGSASNNDGAAKVDYLAPSVDGQARCMAEAYAVADVSPDTIDHIECHGTGTRLGDPIEVAALTRAFRAHTDRTGFCRLTSVKSAIGHLDTAAGVVGLIKVALSLHHRAVPPTLNFETPNPALELEGSPFVVNDQLTPWTRGRHPRRAAINSLGVGGTNVHVVLEEAPSRPRPADPGERLHLLRLSARTPAALDAAAARLADHLEAHPTLALDDVAWSLEVGRRALETRRVVVARELHEAVRLLREPARGHRAEAHRALRPSAAFLFPGGGSQYVGMGAGLHATEPAFRAEMERGLELLRTRHGLDLRDAMLGREGTDRAALEPMERQVPALFLVGHALAHAWRHRGIEPGLLLGHSLGENTAACVAGVMSFEDALGLVVLRGRLFAQVTGGAMTSVRLTRGELEALLAEGVDGGVQGSRDLADLDIAALNAPDLTVASGPAAAIAALEAILAARDVEFRRLVVPVAAHSRQLDPVLDTLRAYLHSIPLSPPTIPLLSNVDGRLLDDARATDPEYWVSQLRAPVNFTRCIDTLLAGPERILVETGPGRALTSLVRQHSAEGRRLRSVLSLRHADESIADDVFLLQQLGEAWACGLSPRTAAASDARPPRRVPLPTYPFESRRHFLEATVRGAEPATSSSPAKIPSVERWGVRPGFRPTKAPAPAETSPSRVWLFEDRSGLGARLRLLLEARGCAVVSILDGADEARPEEGRYSLSPELGAEGHTALVEELVARGLSPSHVVHLWSVTPDTSHRPGSSFFHHAVERGFDSLLHLAQALGVESGGAPLQWIAVADGMQQVDTEAVPHPERAMILGPMGVLPREFPGTHARAVDLRLEDATGPARPGWTARFRPRQDPSTALDALAAALLAEVLAQPSSGVIALRRGRRFEACLDPLPLRRGFVPDAPALDHGAIVLITGGLGGLGLVFAEHLARAHGASLVLVGRAGLPPRETWEDAGSNASGGTTPIVRIDASTRRAIEVVRRLEAGGTEVMVASADVTLESDMREVVRAARARFGRIDGVIHAAGTLRDAPLAGKTRAECEEVLAPKVHGARVLERVLDGDALSFFVLFGSTSSMLCPAGQVDYVAANAFLDAFAQSRRAQGRPALVLDWGIWNGIGMTRREDAPQAEETTPREETPPQAPASEEHSTRVEVRPSRALPGPMLDALVTLRDEDAVFSARWDARARWFLDEHRTAQGVAVLPGTGMLALAREALTQWGRPGGFEARDLTFLRPLTVADDAPCAVALRLRQEGSAFACELHATGPSGPFDDETRIAEAELRLLDDGTASSRRAPRLDLAAIEARCPRVETTPSGWRSPQERHLRFGARWRVVQSIRWGDGEALADLALPVSFDDAAYPLHPSVLDLATGFGISLAAGYNDADLWVPSGYGQVRVLAPLPARLRSFVRLAAPTGPAGEVARFDITLTDARGETCVECEGFTMRRLQGGRALGVRDGALRESGRDRASAPARHGRDSSRGSERLARDIARGITPEEGLEAFECALETSAREGARGARIAISSMDLEALRARAAHDATAQGSPDGGFDRPDLDTAYTPPADALERAVAALFEGLLGIARVGRDDGFFDLGGHSLVAVRLFAKIRKQWGVELPLASIFDAPTVATTAALLRARGVEASEDPAPMTRAERASGPAANASPSAHLVRLAGPRGPAADAVPLVVVAGMFGNVLNLRQLAEWVGKDRPVYGLQARGVRGAEPPHEDLEEMARDYLAELKTHLHGAPYLLAGFSGGGLTAYEMAQQLKAGGAPVPWLGLLDTPLPRRPALLLRHRWEIRRIELSERSVGELARWMGGKFEHLAASLLAAARGWWHRAHAQPQLLDDEPPMSEAARSERIGAAFRRAAEGYALMPYSGPVTLFRPRPRARWILRDGGRVDLDRHYVEADNGWTPWVASLEVLEVPGDHDSMVLAPHVRVVGEAFRARLDAASRELESASSGPRHDDASGTRSSPALRLTSAPLSEPRARADGA